MTLRMTPYFMLDGTAKEAIQFYEQVLGAQIVYIQTYGEMPMSFPVELKDLVSHAILKVGETDLMFSDSPGQPIQTGNKLTLCISTPDVDTTKRIYEALQQEGKVIGPLEETPFSPAFCSVMDKFSITFTIITEVPN